MEKLLSTAEVAELLGMATGSLDNWRGRGDGPRFIKLGRKVAYDPADVRAWIEARKL